MKRALIVSYHFSPDRAIGAKRPTELVKSMVADGWQVTVLTRNIEGSESRSDHLEASVELIRARHLPGILNPAYMACKHFLKKVKPNRETKAKEQFDECEDSEEYGREHRVNVLFRLKRLILSSQALLDSTKGWLISAFALLVLLKIKRRQFDLVISSSPPSSVNLIAWGAKAFFGARWILDLRDPLNMWELAEPACRAPFRIALEDWLEKKYLCYTDLIVVTTDLLKSELESVATRNNYKYLVERVYNGFDGDFIQREAGPDQTFELAFAGELYANRNPFPLLTAIRDLLESNEVSKSHIRFHLYGKCESWNGHSVSKWLEDYQLNEVIRIHGMLTPTKLEKELARAHLLVSFAQKQPLQIPAKTFDYIRYPCKSLVITEAGSSTGDFVAKNGFGFASDDDRTQLKAAILVALKDYQNDIGKPLSDEELERRQIFSRANQNKNYLNLVNTLNG